MSAILCRIAGLYRMILSVLLLSCGPILKVYKHAAIIGQRLTVNVLKIRGSFLATVGPLNAQTGVPKRENTIVRFPLFAPTSNTTYPWVMNFP